MNYEHAFHAGNPADVLKHSALTLLLLELTRRQDPLHYLETHAGSGLYTLDDPTGEWTQGIGKLASKSARRKLPELIPYLDFLPWNDGVLGEYPGSPLIAEACLREEDTVELWELKASAEQHLRGLFPKGKGRVSVHGGDGYEAVHRTKIPEGTRLVVHLDPPFEKVDEWDTILHTLVKATRKRPSAVFMLWYPVKEGPPHASRPEELRSRLEAQKVPGVAVELTSTGGMLAPRTDVPKVRGALLGSGLLFVGAPHRAIAKLGSVLPELARSLARSEHGQAWQARWFGWL